MTTHIAMTKRNFILNAVARSNSLSKACILVVVFSVSLAAWADAPFAYAPVSGTIQSAQFVGNFAALVANQTLFGFQVNSVVLVGQDGTTTDLSNALFGNQPWPAPPNINLGPLQTMLESAAIPSSFFSELATGSVGYSILLTSTGNNGLFAMTSLSLDIMTSNGEVQASIGPNDGFGLGIAANGDLAAPLPDSIGIGATGTGFDEAISSKSLTAVPVPEPGVITLLASGAPLLLWRRRKHFKGLLMVCFAAILTIPAYAKKVVCISGPKTDPYLANAEGYEREHLAKGDQIRSGLTTPQEFQDCVSLAANGDTLIIVAHSNKDGAIDWGGSLYYGFGSTFRDLPVPADFDKLKNLTIQIVGCYSECVPSGGDSLCNKIKKASGGGGNNNTCTGFKGKANPGAAVSFGDSTDVAAQNAALECLNADPSWQNKPSANSGAKDNQETAAQKIVNNCPGAKNITVHISYDLPPSAEACQEDQQHDRLRTADVLDICGDGDFGSLGSPSQCHSVGPYPNQVQVGATASITATVQALFHPFDDGSQSESLVVSQGNSVVTPPHMDGVPDRQVILTTLVGSVTYTDGAVSSDGNSTSVITGDLGMVLATVVPTRRGSVLIRITVPGTGLVAYSFFNAI
jgi:hypothetical protein